jgi:hypothetical protein
MSLTYQQIKALDAVIRTAPVRRVDLTTFQTVKVSDRTVNFLLKNKFIQANETNGVETLSPTALGRSFDQRLCNLFLNCGKLPKGEEYADTLERLAKSIDVKALA